jgi:4-hydroxy 2-oxovalerate aldolase
MTKTDPEESPMSRWGSDRLEIKIIDCTVRNGGLMNNHKFDDETVKAIYLACIDARIDYMELGYINSKRIFSSDEWGAWQFCREDDIRRIVGENDTTLKLSAMANAEKSDYREDILPCDQSVLDTIRVATYIHQIPLAIDMIKDAHDKGYETTVNIMAVSTVNERELNEAPELLANSEVGTIYVVDSFGSMYSEQIQLLIDKYMGYVKPHVRQVGMHAHNNQ